MDYYKKYLKYKEKYLQLKKQIGGALIFNYDNINKKIFARDNESNNVLGLRYSNFPFARVIQPISAIFLFNGTSYTIELAEEHNPINIDRILTNDEVKRELKNYILFMDERVNNTIELNNNHEAVHAMARLKSITNRL